MSFAGENQPISASQFCPAQTVACAGHTIHGITCRSGREKFAIDPELKMIEKVEFCADRSDVRREPLRASRLKP